MGNEVKKLYSALINKGYTTKNLGDEQTFMSKMQDADNRKQLYDWVNARGDFRIGSYEDYEKRLTAPPAPKAEGINPPTEVDKSRYTFTAEELGIEEPEKAVEVKEPTEENKKRIMAYSSIDKSVNPFILPSENHDVVKDPYLREAMSARKQIADKEKYIHTLGNAATEADREELQRLKEAELAALHDSEHAVGVDANPFGQVVGAVTYPVYKLVEGVGDVLGNKSINKFGKQSAERAVALMENRTTNGRPALENEWLDLRNNALYKNGKDGDLTILGTVLQSTEELAAGLTDPVYRAADWIGEKTGASLLEEIGEAGRANIDEIYANSQYKDNSFLGKFAQLVPQLAGTAASLLTGNPVLAKASMGAMVGSSMGSAAREAEKEGASLLEQFAAAGLNGVIELGTEKFSLGHWLGKIATKVGTRTLKEAGEEVVEKEAEALFKEAKKELGGKITAKTVKEFAKDLVVEGGSEATAEFLQTLVPIIYRDKDKWPTWHEAFQNAWDGAIGGLMMAGTLHGVGSYAQRKANDKRWQEQGFIDAAIVGIKDKKGKDNLVVAEVVGEDENGNISILSDNKIIKVSKEDIKTRQQFEYNDFKSNVMSIYRSEGYSQNPELINGNTIALAGKAVNDAKAEVRAALSLNDDVDVDAMIADKEFQGDAKMAVDKYLAEKARYEGMQDRLNEERENEIAEAEKSVDAVMHEDGNVYMTTLPSTGEAIFITGGKVVLDNEGYIDVNQSEGLVALMPNGKKEAIQPGNIREKVSVENAEAKKAVKRAEIDARYKSQLNTFVYSDGMGDHTVQLIGRRENLVDVIVDGRQMEMGAQEFDNIMAEVTGNAKVEGENDVQPVVAPVVEGQKGENAVESSPTGEVAAPVVEAPKTALEQIPKNEKNVPLYEQVDSELAWDGVVEEAGGNEETAMVAVNSMVEDKKKALAAAEKAKARAGVTISEKIAAENERVANIEKAKADLAKWEEIAGVKAKRAAAQAENVAQPTVETAPVVESAPVEDNTPQSQSDSSPTLVEQPTPQATNEMQEADLTEDVKTEDVNQSENNLEMVAEGGNAPGNGGVVDNNSANALQNGNNELNLQKENESDNESNQNDIPVGGQVSQSVSQGEHGEVASLSGGVQETATRLRERIESAQRDPKSGLREVENRVTREFAQENGLWIEDEFKLGVPFPSGDEHNNYIDAENQVIYKVNNRMHTPSILGLLDRMELHNKYFPNTQYRLVGFTSVSENGDVMPVFAQDFVLNAHMATVDEIDSYMGTLGFTRVGDGRYSNGEVVIKDLKPRNVLVNPNGDAFVVDAEFEQEKAQKSDKTAESTPEIQEPRSVEEVLENGDKRITNYNSRGEVATVVTERDGKVVSVDSYDEGVLFEHTEYDGNGKAASVTRYDKSGNAIGTQAYVDGKAVPSETAEQPETGEVADAGPVNMETLQLNMSEEDFNALLNSGDKAAISEYLAEMDGLLRIGVGSPLDGQEALREEYRKAVERYGKENIPTEVMDDLNSRMQPYSDLSRAIFDRKYALQDKLREIEASEAQAKEQAEKEAKAERKKTAFGGFLAGKTDVGASTAEKALSKKYNFDGKVMTVAEFVEDAVGNGNVKLSAIEEPKYKGASRAAWNRMDARQQEADAKRVKESGTKMVYTVNDHDLGKTAYDYARFLLDKKAEQEKADAKKAVENVIKPFAKEKREETKPATEKIEDVGEKIGGARKDIIRQYADKIKLDGKTFSTMFPKPDVDKLVEAGLPKDKVAAVKAMYDNAKREFEMVKKRRGKDKALQASLFYAMYAKNVLTGEEGNFDLAYNGFVFTEWGKEFMKANIALYKAVFNKLGTDYGKVDLRSYFISPLVAGMREYFNLKKLNEENSTRQQRMAEMDGRKVPEYKDGDLINFVGEHYSRPSDQFETLEEAVNTMVERISKEVKVDEAAQYKVESYWKRDAHGRADYTKAYLGIKVRGFGTVDVMEFKNMNEANTWLQNHKEDFQQMAAAKEEQVRAEKKKPLPKYVLGHSYNEAQSQYSVFADFGKEGVRILKTFDIPQAEGVTAQAKVRSEVYKNEVLPYINSEEAVQSADGIAQEIRDAKNAKPKSITIEKKSRERVGVDWRNGKDATPEMFVDVEGKEPSVFGFRAIEFGNYVSQKERQQYLNDIYDALMDMSEVLGVSPRALSLGGKLALAVGARGTSGASGHYEPYKNVINITKTKGAGVLAHEWLHALDRYFSNFDENALYPNGVRYATGKEYAENTRQEIKDAFEKIMSAVRGGEYQKRSARLGDYWASDKELAARALQDYMMRKLDERGQKNDFLSNHLAPEDWAGDMNNYPFPLGAEADRIAEAFDNFFATVEEKTEDGQTVLFQQGTLELDRENPAFERATKVTMDAVERLKENGVKVNETTENEFRDKYEAETEIIHDDKTKVSEIAANVEKQIEELRSIKEEQTLISNTDNPTSSLTQETEQPSPQTSGGNVVAPYEAKINKKLRSSRDLARKMLSFLDKIKEGEVKAENFPADLVENLGVSKQVEGSEYVHFVSQDGEKITLRLSDHHGNARNIIIKGVRTDKGVSIVISLPGVDLGKYKANKWAKVDEYVYESPSVEQLYNIGKSIFNLFNSGEYIDLADAKEHLRSPRVTELKANGVVYGWAMNGEIYLTPDGINPNTPMHEYAHLWGADVEKNNPKLWNEVVEAMKLSPVWNEVANDANYSYIHGNDSRMASEVLARLSGRENYRRTMEEAEKEIAAERDIVGKVQKKGILNRIKNALENFWNWVQRNVFKRGERSNVKAESESASEVMPWEEFANSVVGDFYKGKNPNVKESPLERMVNKVDRDGNPIGDGSWHMNYKVDEVALSYPNISYKVDESASTESVYVTYTNNDPKYPENERPKVTVRYSNHDSNAVKFGDQLRGHMFDESTPVGKRMAERQTNILLTRLGLKKAVPVYGKYIPNRMVSNREIEQGIYEETDKTIQEMYDLPIGTDISQYKGKVAKGSRYLIEGDEVERGQIKDYKFVYVSKKEPVEEYVVENNANFVSTYKTEDGKDIEYTSERAEGYGIQGGGTRNSYDGTGNSILQRQTDTGVPGGNSGLNTEKGEFCVVERVFTENGAFNFTSGEKIESADDVAYIFSALEDAAKEHSFVVYVKDGKPTVIELGMGSFNETMVDIPTASLAYSRISPDRVYFVHNHPSGNLICSDQDVAMLRVFEDMSDVPVTGVIINLKTGKYGTFDTERHSVIGEKRVPENEERLTVHTLDKQIFAPDYDPMAQPLVRSSQDVAQFLNSQRMGDRPKVSFLILSRANRIIGNIHTPFTDITTDTEAVARYINERVIQFGGENAILYGDFAISMDESRGFRLLQGAMERFGKTKLLDVVHVEGNFTKSANDLGLLYEPEADYGVVKESEQGYGSTEQDIPVESVQTQPMTFKERIINETLTTSAKNKENLALRSDALRMFGRDVANILKLMGKQREYDKSTVDQLVKLAKMYFKDAQLLGGLTPYQVSRVMTRLNNAVGKKGAEMQEGETLFSKKELTPEQKKKKEALKENAKAIRRLHNVTSRFPITALRYLGSALETQEQREMHDRLFAERDAITGESMPAGLQTNPQAMTLLERITESLLKQAEQEKENVEMRLSAIRAYGRDLANVIKLMNAQKVYDRNTVRMFTDLVKMYLRNNAMDGLSSYKIARLLNLMQRATGGHAKTVNRAAVEIAEIITGAHTKQLNDIMEKQIKTGKEKVNASGVVVQGGVDIIGKRILNTYKDAINLDDKGFEEKYNSAFERVGNLQKSIKDAKKAGKDTKSLENLLKEAQAEADAMLLAATYRNEVKAAEADITKIKDKLTEKRTKAEKGEITWKEYHEFAKTINSQIVQLRAQQIDAYQKVLHALSGDIYEGVQRARAFREAEAKRVQKIHDMAENDMNGVSKSAERKEPGVVGKTVDMMVYKRWSVRAVMNGMGTYENYMKYFGRDYVDGKGELFNYFITAFNEAQDKEWKESQNDFNILEAAAQKIFGKRNIGKTYKAIARESTKPSGVVLKYWDGGATVERELTIGQLMYLYMTEKQTEGQMKLRNMGLTEEKVKAAVEQLPTKYKKFADYIQAEFLPQMRPRMNEVHQRMFGASMSEVENYFPLKVNQNARKGDADLNNSSDPIPSTITGAVIKRRVNVTPIDLTANAFDVLNEHIVDMEHWAAFAEFTRDNNTLINDNDFKNRVKNTKSIRYGDGETAWNDFVDTARIVTGNYKARKDYLAKLMSGANAAKITFGGFTALKQIASLPAFLGDANVFDLMWTASTPVGWWSSWNWAIKNLPGFEERWKNRTGGNERLGENEYSIHDSRIMKAARKVGMTPNAFIDAVVVASGARAVYNTRLRFYKSLGLTEYEADKRAKNDAAISYNETQQSGQGAYLSSLQKDSGLVAMLTTLFRNSQMAFQRRVVGSMVGIGKKLARGERIREATKQKYIKMGVDEATAEKQATNEFYKSYAKDFTNLAIFGYGMNYLWVLIGQLPYLLFGDDEEEKEKIYDMAKKVGVTGMFEGFTLGNFAKGLYEKHITDGKYVVGLLEAPFEGDLQKVIDSFEKDGTAAGILQLGIILTEMNTGISPQRLIDLAAAFIDDSDGDVKLANDGVLLGLRILEAPQSQQDMLILDEIYGADAEKVKKVAERYIEYKMNRNLPFGSEDEKRVDKYANKFVETLKERVEKDYNPEDISVIYDQSSDTEKEILKKKWLEEMDKRNGTNVAKSLRKEKLQELLGSPIEKAAAKALHRISKVDPYEKMETYDDLERWYEYKVLLDVFQEDYDKLRKGEEIPPEEREKAGIHYEIYKDKNFKEIVNAISTLKKLIKKNDNPEWRMGEIRRLTDVATEIMKRYE